MIARHDAYQADTLPKGRREGIQDIHSRVKPLCQSIIAPRLIEIEALLLQHEENGGGRVTGLEL